LNPKEKLEQQKLEACPHCGHKLSPWQQVLLNVDRALTCKNCWYRIILDVFENEKPNKEDLNNHKGQ
jgi:DNA-directed RNA polymerase subunit RPC12/RpoP